MIFPKLFHGTDARIIEMSKQDRLQYINKCKLVIDYIFPFLEKLHDEQVQVDIVLPNGVIIGKGLESRLKVDYKHKLDAIPNLYVNLCEKINMIKVNRLGDGNYQYGALYLTTNYDKACRYATCSYAGGEFASLAYRLILGAEIIKPTGFNPSDEVIAAIDAIKSFAEDDDNVKPIVITFSNIDIKDLVLENGNEITDSLLQIIDYLDGFRYLKDVELTLDNATYL